MVTINVAFTSPINPAGATPVLTLGQVWAGLERKIRFAQEFVPVILGTEVLEETTEGTGSEAVPVVVREATFKEGFREGDPKVKEVCKCYEPSRVCLVFLGRCISLPSHFRDLNLHQGWEWDSKKDERKKHFLLSFGLYDGADTVRLTFTNPTAPPSATLSASTQMTR